MNLDDERISEIVHSTRNDSSVLSKAVSLMSLADKPNFATIVMILGKQ